VGEGGPDPDHLHDTTMPVQNIPECLAGNINSIGTCAVVLTRVRSLRRRP